MGGTDTSAEQLAAELIVHLGRIARSDDPAGRLTPAQWTALRFFARANQVSRTPSAFASFHATTRGTASQTIKSLIRLDYLERRRADADGRSIRFEPTAAGWALLREDPLHALTEAIGDLPAERRRVLLDSLQALVARVAGRRSLPVFGTCQRCVHLGQQPCGGEAEHFCNCRRTHLLAAELDQLCIEFSPPAEVTGAGE